VREVHRGNDLKGSFSMRLIEFAAHEYDAAMPTAKPGPALLTAEVDTPIGPILVATDSDSVVLLAFQNADWESAVDSVEAKLGAEAKPASQRLLNRTTLELDEYFAGLRTNFSVPVSFGDAAGYRLSVLQLTANIPYGETRSYGDVAAAAGNSKAVRAAGTSVGLNPVPIIVPCHRVVRSDGSIGKFSGGSETKRLLLEHEANNA